MKTHTSPKFGGFSTASEPRELRPFFAPDDAGGTAQASETSHETSESDGKNAGTQTTDESTATTETDKAAQSQADAEADKGAATGFKPITSQKELDKLLGERLKREREKVAERERQKKLEGEGKWKELYEAAKAAHEAQIAELQSQSVALQKQISEATQSKLIADAIAQSGLNSTAAELFREAVEGKDYDAKTLQERAQKFASVVAAPTAAQTEAGQKSTQTAGQSGKVDNYSFNTPGGVKW